MASTVSTDNNANEQVKTNTRGFLKNYVRNSIIENRKVLIVITVLNILSFPLALITLTYDLYQEYQLSLSSNGEYVYYSGSSGWFTGLAVLFSGVAILSGVMIALNNFSYLYKKQNVDMYMALPLKSSQRFLCDYLSGIACYIGPFLLSGLMTFFISLISMNIVPDMGRPLSGSMYLSGFIVRCYLGAACIMIMYYTLTVLVCTICGNLFETRFYTVLINGLIPGMIAIVILVFFGGGFGLVYEEYITPIISRTSPIGALIGLGLYGDMHGADYLLSVGFIAGYCLSLLIVSALYAYAAYLLYKNRKAEDVSKPFVYNIFFYIIMTCIMLAMSAMAPESDEAFVPLIFFMAVVYLVFEVVNKRGFKKFRNALLRCAVTIAACVGVSMLCYSSNGFGLSYRVPSADSVRSVTISYVGPEELTGNYWGGSLDDTNSITVSDKETIESIIAAQRSVIKKYDEERDYPYSYDSWGWSSYNTTTVRIKYKLKSGTSFTREYKMTDEEIDMLNAVCHDSGYVYEAQRLIESYMLQNSYIYVYDGGLGIAVLSVSKSADPSAYRAFAQELSEAYAEDIAARSMEQLSDTSTHAIAYITVSYRDMYIYPWDTNTIAMLQKYGAGTAAVSLYEETTGG